MVLQIAVVACFIVGVRAQNFDYGAATDILTSRCVENGATEDTTSLLSEAPSQLNLCLQSQVDYTKVQTELEEAKKTGSMDEVAQKYCSRYPQIAKCLESVTDTFRPCFNSTEQEYINQTFVFLELMKDYFCANEGNHIAMFISQGGVECMETIKDEFGQCFNGTDGGQLLYLREEACEDLMVVRRCFYKKLTKCEGDIPANIVDAFFKQLSKKSGCVVNYRSFIQDDDDLWVRMVIIGGYLVVALVICYKLAV